MLNINIECDCGECILTSELCPNKNYPFQLARDFCSKAKAKKDICHFCYAYSYQNNKCTNYFFCGMAQEAKDFNEKRITIDQLTRGTKNMLIEMNVIRE